MRHSWLLRPQNSGGGRLGTARTADAEAVVADLVEANAGEDVAGSARGGMVLAARELPPSSKGTTTVSCIPTVGLKWYRGDMAAGVGARGRGRSAIQMSGVLPGVGQCCRRWELVATGPTAIRQRKTNMMRLWRHAMQWVTTRERAWRHFLIVLHCIVLSGTRRKRRCAARM